MHYGVRRRFLSGIIFFFLAANISFSQVPARRFIGVPPALVSSQKKAVVVKPKVRPLRAKLPTKVFGASHRHGLLSYHTTTSGNKTKIAFDIELGEPSFLKSSVIIKGSDGRQFGTLLWSNLSLIDFLTE